MRNAIEKRKKASKPCLFQYAPTKPDKVTRKKMMPIKMTGKRSQLMHWLSWFEASHIPAEIMGIEHIRAMKLRIAIKLLLTAMFELSS